MTEFTRPQARADCNVSRSASASEQAGAHGRYIVECRAADGELRWSEPIENIVTAQGKNDALDKHLSGRGYTAAWYMGLISAAGFLSAPVETDTASDHPGWIEAQGYAQTSRPSVSFAGAVSGTKTTSSVASFEVNANATVKGCFLVSSNSKGGAAGVLYSAGLFAAGNKVAQPGDVLNISYSASLL